MVCILFVTLLGACFGIVGLLVERALPPRAPRRWVWCAVIALSMVVPPYSRAQHAAPVTTMLEGPLGQLGATSSFALLDPAWWKQVDSHHTAVTRVWLGASALLLAWGLVGAWQLSRIVRRARRMHGAAPDGTVVDGVAVVVTDAVGPATAGFWRSRVLVPHWVLSLPEAERRYVLRHEDEHRRAHDVHLLLATSLMLVVTPWNLALWWQLHRLGLAVEMDCDSRVVTALGDPASYGHALLSVAQVATSGPRLRPGFVGGAGSLERRLTMLVTPDRLRHFQRVLFPALAIVLLLLALSMPHPVAVEHLPHR